MNKLSSNQIFGILLVVLGALFTLDNLSIIELDLAELIFSLPTLFFLVGVSAFNRNDRPLKSYVLMTLAGVGWVLIVMGYSPFNLLIENWPVILILIGLSMIFGRSKRTVRSPNASAEEETAEDLNDFVFMRGLKRRLTPADFDGDSITVVMGAAEIDFSECNLSGGKAVLNVTVIMGGMELRVPGNWNVIYNGVTLFGGTEDQRLKYPNFNIDINNTLEIKGLVLFGGLEIK